MRLRLFTSLLATLAATQHAARAAPEHGAAAADSVNPSVEDLIQRGIALRRTGDDPAALEIFHEAERRKPGSVRIMLHIVTAAQAAGRWLEASAYMQEVSKYKDDPYYRKFSEEIASVERAIASRVGSLLAVGTPRGAEVRLNGSVIGTLPMQRAEPIQSGAYVIEISLAGYYKERRNVAVAGGVLTREAFALNPLPAAAAMASTGGDADAATIPDPGAAERQWFEQPWVTWALAGTSAALLTTSAVAFVVREGHAYRWNDDEHCAPLGGLSREQNCAGERRAAERAEAVGIATGIAGVVFAGAALTQRLVFVEPGQRERPPSDTRSADGQRARCGLGLLQAACQVSF
jgi:hypothetical protein